MVTRPKLRLARYLVPVIIVLAIIFSIRQCGNQEKPSGHPRDYAAIAKEGILRVATEYNSISFYVDGDTVSGFHYELIQAFAYDKGLKTEITPLGRELPGSHHLFLCELPSGRLQEWQEAETLCFSGTRLRSGHTRGK